LKALILVNGELHKPDVLRGRIRAAAFDLVLGADGGTRHACILNVTLDSVIGDMDSLSDMERQNISNADFVSYPSGKDETDLELALRYAEGRGADDIVMVGSIGGRVDMTIANILLLTRAGLSSSRFEVWHGEQTLWVIKPPGENIPGSVGDTVSLIPLGGTASGITTRGLKYPLKGEEISFGQTRGISNLVEESPASIQLSGGLLLAVHIPGQV
jgi:thiamine pyrophosphokinase